MAKKTFECPNCGAPVPVGRKGCRECGSDAQTGWQDAEEIDYQSIEIPDGYGPADELSSETPREQRTKIVAGLLVALIAAVVIIVLFY